MHEVTFYTYLLAGIELAEKQNATEDLSCLPKMVLSGTLFFLKLIDKCYVKNFVVFLNYKSQIVFKFFCFISFGVREYASCCNSVEPITVGPHCNHFEHRLGRPQTLGILCPTLYGSRLGSFPSHRVMAVDGGL